MSRFSGPQDPEPMHRRGRNKGALARLRAARREEAVERNAATPQNRRRAYRDGPAGKRA